MNGITFDAGGLIALDRSHRRVADIAKEAIRKQARICVPATALAQTLRDPAKQVPLQRLIQYPGTEVVPLNHDYARQVGLLLASTRTSDIADAHVVICAQRADHAVITSDPLDLRRLDRTLRLLVV